MKTIIAGSRNASLKNVIEALELCPFTEIISEVVSGGAKGADKYGEKIAKEFSTPIKIFLADWKKYKKQAGYIRNGEMADYAEALIAVWDGKSSGTKNMIQISKDKGLKVFVHIFKN